jgi:hypothetical protein
MRKKLLALALATTLMSTFVVGAAAQPNQTNANGAVGLVNVIVSALNNLNVTDNNVDVAVVELNNSLNNLTALNNVLNNSPILSNNDIIDDITVIGGDVILTDVLNENQISVLSELVNADDVVAVITVLGSSDFLVITK